MADPVYQEACVTGWFLGRRPSNRKWGVPPSSPSPATREAGNQSGSSAHRLHLLLPTMTRVQCTGAVLAACLAACLAHTYHLGDCPSVEPMSGFEMSRFLGVWHVVQKTSTGSKCLFYNLTESSEPGQYHIEQVSEHPVLGLASIDNRYHYTGELKAYSRDVPAKMSVKFPLNPAGSASFIVFMTDYENYAGIYTCQKLPASNRRSASILSRKPTLDRQYIDKIRNRLSNFGVNPYDLSLINHSGCPQAGFEFGVDPDTLSASSIAGVVRKAGDVLGDTIESTVDSAKKAYHAVKSDKEIEELA